MLNSDILGINARNLLYVKKFNPKKSIRLADNKLKTKHFLIERGIPVPETYAVIKSRNDLYNFDFSTLPEKEFVIKPNKGSGGKGINIVKMFNEKPKNYQPLEGNFLSKYFRKNNKNYQQETDGGYYFKIGGEYLNEMDLRRYLTDIVDGKYSLTSGNDKIIIEEKMLPSSNFQKYCRYGLADIRIIVFNLIPVAGMIRVPTYESGGKANISQGGVGLGIEVGSGKIKSMYYKNQIFDKNFPGEFKEFFNKKTPFWNDIMLLSSRVQYFENLGFLALDWVITDDGPKLLEINSRAGLEVQNASILPLKRRLEKVGDTKVKDPEKGVEIAKSLFTTAKTNISVSKVLYISQRANLVLEGHEEESKYPTIVEIDLKKEKNYISRDLYEQIKDFKDGDVLIDIYENEVRFKNIALIPSDKISKGTIILGSNIVSEYYIKPIHKIHHSINIVNNENIVEEELEKIDNLDQNLSKISKKLNLSFILKPTNYLDELDNFITWNGNYNPTFEYKRPDDKRLDDLREQLYRLKENNFSKESGLVSRFSWLFEEKINDLLIRINTIKSYKYKKYGNILENNIELYGDLDNDLLKLSKEKIFIEDEQNEELLGKVLYAPEIKKRIQQYLKDKNMNGVKVVSNSTILGRMSIYKGKTPEIRVGNMATFREKELLATLAHEVDVHLVRFLNGDKTGWNILKSGTGFYIKDEEGMAIYNSFNYMPQGYERKGMYKKYYLISQAQKYSFSRLVDIIRGLEDRTLKGSFNTALRLKRGVKNTGFIDKGAINMKDKVYLDGYMKIKDWIESGGDIERFMLGKIKTQDLDYI